MFSRQCLRRYTRRTIEIENLRLVNSGACRRSGESLSDQRLIPLVYPGDFAAECLRRRNNGMRLMSVGYTNNEGVPRPREEQKEKCGVHLLRTKFYRIDR